MWVANPAESRLSDGIQTGVRWPGVRAEKEAKTLLPSRSSPTAVRLPGSYATLNAAAPKNETFCGDPRVSPFSSSLTIGAEVYTLMERVLLDATLSCVHYTYHIHTLCTSHITCIRHLCPRLHDEDSVSSRLPSRREG